MLTTQRTLDRDPGCRQRLDQRGDVLSASFAADHKIVLAWWTLEHENSVGE